MLPEDINLVSGPPSLRRWHIDLTLAQIDRVYKKALTGYTEAITSRNRILKRIKEGLSKMPELDFWNQQILENGRIVQEKRQILFGFLNQSLPRLDRDLPKLGDFRFNYLKNEISADRLREYVAREVAASTSLIGPHRDDFVFKSDSRDLAHFGSRGEQRTAVLDLKLSELQFIKQIKGTTPILLLDDVFSELDMVHREHVIGIISGQQTIISAVETENIPTKFLNSVKVILVKAGTMTFPEDGTLVLTAGM